MKFFGSGEVNYPYLSHGIWFLTQFRRWGLLADDPPYLEVARQVNQVALYEDVAKETGIALPASPLKSERLFDGKLYDPQRAAEYAAGFEIRA